MRPIFVSVCTFIFYNIPSEYMNGRYTICLFRILLERECFGCGTVRGFWCILHLRFEDAFHLNKMIFVTFPLSVFVVLIWTIGVERFGFVRKIFRIL
ncbi:PF10825 family protein [Leptospira weilii serovar Ranarum str. ICFT]|uniref:PF10825 family protein n=1 Tax=Leptospira weilii serovar Ranarum str. ICFT TaxID=1218598 RepID=N1WFU5_9LEPT|nr:DUF2752 domain-containing protein [Leptospira weilii]EMY75984.1 PF10825 family protein [Leptospira weilii serovar Ranarum str. ICFT]